MRFFSWITAFCISKPNVRPFLSRCRNVFHKNSPFFATQDCINKNKLIILNQIGVSTKNSCCFSLHAFWKFWSRNVALRYFFHTVKNTSRAKDIWNILELVFYSCEEFVLNSNHVECMFANKFQTRPPSHILFEHQQSQ